MITTIPLVKKFEYRQKDLSGTIQAKKNIEYLSQ